MAEFQPVPCWMPKVRLLPNLRRKRMVLSLRSLIPTMRIGRGEVPLSSQRVSDAS
ncbi:hypothetical protein D3C87_1858350 [compost metagenome]